MNANSHNPEHDAASPRLNEHYSQYFASQEQLEWYELMAMDKAANVMTICADVPHDSILDIGAGDGAVLHQLDQHGFGNMLHAIDVSETGLAAIRAKKWRHLESASLFDGQTVPFPDQSFDLAILSHVVEHLEHPRITLREASRVARHVYVEVPLEYALANRRLRRDFVLDATGRINFFNPTLIRLLVQTCELDVVRQDVRHFTPMAYTRHRGRRGLINYYIKEVALRLSPRMATKFFNYHCGLLCRRSAPIISSSPSGSEHQPLQAG